MSEAIDLTKSIVIVTGAARGLGRTMTLGLLTGGARVGAVDLPESRDLVADLLSEAAARSMQDRLLAAYGSVTDEKDCARVVQEIATHFGGLTGLVNNAGRGMNEVTDYVHSRPKKFYEVEPALWCGILHTNVAGPYLMARAAVPHFLARGWGRIVNLVTSLVTMLRMGYSPYGPSKAALEAATVIWAKDLTATGITVNALLPGGPADTRMIPSADVPERAGLIKPEVMVAPVRWLMSHASDGVTGWRFIANDWDPALDPQEAAKKAGRPGAW
jgi:3-oxoacyl-[acyl-carrier protein] reductase